jgi:hypothetical protein
MCNFKNLSKRVSIKDYFKSISFNFIKVIVAYHKIFRRLVKGEIWEDIFENIVYLSNIKILSEVDTSHVSGRDIELIFGWFSNKTVELKRTKKK